VVSAPLCANLSQRQLTGQGSSDNCWTVGKRKGAGARGDALAAKKKKEGHLHIQRWGDWGRGMSAGMTKQKRGRQETAEAFWFVGQEQAKEEKGT